MNHRIVIILLAIVITGGACSTQSDKTSANSKSAAKRKMAAPAAVTASKKLPDGAQFIVDGNTLRIQFWSQSIARITYANGVELPTIKSLAVVASPSPVRLTRQENRQAFTLATPQLKVRIDKQSGAVSFLDTADQVLLQEAPAGRKIEPATQAGIKGNSCTLSFELPPDEGVYGLGQHQ